MYDIRELINAIETLSDGLSRISIMEVCGTHTAAIHRYGINSVLPDNIKFISGPGCPVCVTSQKDICAAVSIADRDSVIFTCFGDMMRVPCENGSLYSLYEKGRDIRLVTSPMDALKIASDNPDRQVVYFGIGFETTAGHTAALIKAADEKKADNLSVLNVHKTMPDALECLLKDNRKIDALICPGHVAAIIGAESFSFVPERLHLPAVIAGFEAYDIFAAVLKVTDMLRSGRVECENMYPRAVSKEGNKTAHSLIYDVMEPCDSEWRGLGSIPRSGLRLKEKYSGFDALCRFEIPEISSEVTHSCLCADILRGEKSPFDCPNFASICTPDSPLGPCMVSSEGCCYTNYFYPEEKEKIYG